MKTQIILSSYDTVFFPVPPTNVRKSDHINGGDPNSSRVSSESITAKRISACGLARHLSPGLPASLEDWLVCKEALEIRQKGRDGTGDGSHS
jgi:hypothetical protein